MAYAPGFGAPGTFGSIFLTAFSNSVFRASDMVFFMNFTTSIGSAKLVLDAFLIVTTASSSPCLSLAFFIHPRPVAIVSAVVSRLPAPIAQPSHELFFSA